MMLPVRSYILASLLCLAGMVGSQPKDSGLAVGDKVPDVIIGNVLNHPKGEVNLRDFEGELLVLDFMGIFCAPCIKHLAHFDSLQNEIEGLTVLPVVPGKKERVRKILDRKEWRMPFGVEREAHIYTLFPYKVISHLVWIMDGTVVAITGAKELTRDNVQAFLHGEQVVLPQKNDMISYDRHKPLLVDGNGGKGESLYYQSVITGYIPGIPGGYSAPQGRVMSVNTSIITLYQRLFSESKQSHLLKYDNRTILEVEDSVVSMIKGDVGTDNQFCFSLYAMEVTEKHKLVKWAQTEVNRFFGVYYGITGHVAKRNMVCYTIQQIGASNLLKARGGKKVRTEEGSTLVLRNQPMFMLERILANKLKRLDQPVVDATGIEYPVDISLRGDLTNVANVRKQLRQYGLDLVESTQEVDMLIIGTTME